MTATTNTTETRGRVRVEHSAKRIRAYLAGELVADTTRPLLVWEKPYYPTYYFPAADVRGELLRPESRIAHSPSRGDAALFTVTAGGTTRAAAAAHYEDSPFETLRDTIRLEWDAMDTWFEEDEQVFTHPRDPYTRVDILASSRHIRVEVDDTTVAETTKPTLLFETGLPVRYYLPKTHVHDLWEINEAFASVTLNAIRTLDIDEDRVNVNGGAVALGHPIGATGARLLGTVIHELRRRGGGLGCVALCSGGGQGDAVILNVFPNGT